VDLIIDKAHSWYLQMAVNQGVLCALALFVLAVALILTHIRRKKNGFALAAMVAAGAFLVFGMINNSNVGMTPLFFVLLGVV
jgi:O-antigen ligase